MAAFHFRRTVRRIYAAYAIALICTPISSVDYGADGFHDIGGDYLEPNFAFRVHRLRLRIGS